MSPTRLIPLLLLLLACAPAAPPAVTPASAVVTAALPVPGGLRDDAARLRQPTNDARRDALVALLRERGHEPALQAVPNPRRQADPREQGSNIHLAFGAGQREIVVGAHFDAVYLQDGSLSHGMVDNAAGAVIVARIADALRERQSELRHRIHVALFDLEEVGLVGSRHFAGTLDSARVAAMVNLDIAGYGDGLIFGPAARSGNDRVYQAMWQVCAQWRYSCLEFPEYPPSDDRSFQSAGIPNISVATLPRTEAHQLWLMMNAGPQSGLAPDFAPSIVRTIHTAEDRLERLDERAMQLAHQAILQLVLRLDRELP